MTLSMLDQLTNAAGISMPAKPPSVVSGTDGILNRFLYVGTCSPCMAVGDHVELCMQFELSPPEDLAGVGDTSLVTWVPKTRVAILLVALGDTCTAVYVVATGRMFYATETISLPSGVPAGTILLAHYTEDMRGSYREPRVLVYDVACWGHGTHAHQYENLRSVPPQDRYRLLRDEFTPLLAADKARKCSTNASSTIVLQWVGYKAGACQFLHGGVQVGHEVETLLALSHTDALRPTVLRC
jgi:hypothetical protein